MDCMSETFKDVVNVFLCIAYVVISYNKASLSKIKDFYLQREILSVISQSVKT